jgi:hypothetical protein
VGAFDDHSEAVAILDGTGPAGRDQRLQLVRHTIISQACHSEDVAAARMAHGLGCWYGLLDYGLAQRRLLPQRTRRYGG